MGSSNFVEAVSKLFVQRYAKSPEEADVLAAIFSQDSVMSEQFSKILDLTVEGMQQISQVPPEVRKDMIPVLQMEIQSLLGPGVGGEDDEVDAG